MVASAPLTALRAESARLSAILAGFSPDRWARPTRCRPWDAAALLAHITITLERLDAMLDAPPPAAADTDAVGYYRPDQRFSADSNATRIDTAVERSQAGGPALAAAFAHAWARVTGRCAAAPPGRLVTTRHGDAMTLEDFLITRVVEVAVHGIDLADATGLPRWTTGPAAAVVADLLLGAADRLDKLGWDPVAFIAQATGRDAMTDADRAEAESVGVNWLALG